MEIQEYIQNQPPERQSLLKDIHEIIIANDPDVAPLIEPMMGKEMIIYKCRGGKGMMKYGLASVKKYMSLHALPIYGSAQLHDKYKELMAKANFQKGCINFSAEEEMPLDIVTQLITDCAKVDLQKIREDYLKAKKAKK